MSDTQGHAVALVTGAASGIGRSTALRFGSDETSVFCCDIDETGAEATAAAIRELGGDAKGHVVDVSDEVDVKSAVATAMEHFGRIDVLANVAGVGHFRHTTEESADDWMRILGVNLTGTFLMIREALPALLETKGAIVNVASVAGLYAHPYAAAYGASKGGVISLTRTLALEYASRGVRINAVCPSGVTTPLLAEFAMPEGGEVAIMQRMVPPSQSLSDPEEIATAIAFLASPEMPNMTGSILVVDGGVSV